MQPPPAPADANLAGQTRAQRVGFWLGLVLFVVLLSIPTPGSMRSAVREHFADELPADARRVFEHCGFQDRVQAPGGFEDLVPESAAYRHAFNIAVEARARTMLAAAAVTALVACWWITVAIPIPVTSLLPLVLFPAVGVLTIRQAAVPYADPNVFLFMGGFIIALGIERWNLHRRIALHIVRVVGTSQSRIVLGFMLAAAVLSMWISNTATTLMMLPIGLAIIVAVAEFSGGVGETKSHFSTALMLGIAYAASIGGVATPIGTPPNIAFRGVHAHLFPEAPEISFGHWVFVFLPLVVVFLPIMWLVLTRITCPVERKAMPVGREIIRQDLRRLGPMTRPEGMVLAVFLLTAFLWMTRSIPFGSHNYGWAVLLERLLTPPGLPPAIFRANYVGDATVALAMAVLLFAIPAGRDESTGRREFLMNWQTAQRLPWGILLLFGGGFSIAAGFKDSGLSFWCGQCFAGLGIGNPVLLILCTCLLMTFLTEITSNTATTQVMLPILARVSQTMGVHPLMLMLPATISASCAFMLPVATPPNAIVFGSGHVPMKSMVRTGIILNLIGVALVTATFYLVARPLLGIG